MTDDNDTSRRVRELLLRLKSQSGAKIPTTAISRLRQTASAAVRTGAGLLVGRLRGHEGIDAELVERMVLSMGELKGIAINDGPDSQHMDMDTTLSPESRELLSVLQVRSQPTVFAADGSEWSVSVLHVGTPSARSPRPTAHPDPSRPASV